MLGEEHQQRSFLQQLVYYAERINAVGLLLMGFAFAMILLPFTLVYNAENGYQNREYARCQYRASPANVVASLIAMFVVGGVLVILFTIHEWKYAKYPIMPKRVMNRALLCAVAIDFR